MIAIYIKLILCTQIPKAIKTKIHFALNENTQKKGKVYGLEERTENLERIPDSWRLHEPIQER
jgi:hypothetical protein